MKNLALLLSILISSVSYAQNCPSDTIALKLGGSVTFWGKVDGGKLLATPDKFTDALNFENMNARLKSFRRGDDKSIFFEHLKNQSLCWTQPEKNSIVGSLNDIHIKLQELKIPQSKFSANFIKTTGNEDFGWPYTRGGSVIVPQGRMSKSVVAHELFHVYSRRNQLLHDELYSIVNFHPINDDTKLKLKNALQSRILINPDAPNTDYGLTLNISGKETHAVPAFLLSPTGQFPNDISFIDLNIFSVISKRKIDSSNLFDVIGRNTRYVLHPEELLADNFELLVSKRSSHVQSPLILQDLLTVLQK